MRILINDWQKLTKLPTKELKKVVSVALKNIVGARRAVPLRNIIIGITFVDDKTIRDLNKKYRKKNRPTDVLSFALKEDKLIGDVVISVETAMRQAKYYGHSLSKELKILLIHGILHLFDYDHIKKKDFEIMRKKEKEIYETVS